MQICYPNYQYLSDKLANVLNEIEVTICRLKYESVFAFSFALVHLINWQNAHTCVLHGKSVFREFVCMQNHKAHKWDVIPGQCIEMAEYEATVSLLSALIWGHNTQTHWLGIVWCEQQRRSVRHGRSAISISCYASNDQRNINWIFLTERPMGENYATRFFS